MLVRVRFQPFDLSRKLSRVYADVDFFVFVHIAGEQLLHFVALFLGEPVHVQLRNDFILEFLRRYARGRRWPGKSHTFKNYLIKDPIAWPLAALTILSFLKILNTKMGRLFSIASVTAGMSITFRFLTTTS